MDRHATEKATLTLSVRIKTVENEIEAAAADEARDNWYLLPPLDGEVLF